MALVKTKLGFDLTAILKSIDVSDWNEKCRTKSGGCTDYEDPIWGTQSFMYSFSNNKLLIEIFTAEVCCTCKHKEGIECECIDEPDEFYEFWKDYWNDVTESIELTHKQFDSYLSFNLFDNE